MKASNKHDVGVFDRPRSRGGLTTDGTILRETLQEILPVDVINELADWYGVVQRDRKQLHIGRGRVRPR